MRGNPCKNGGLPGKVAITLTETGYTSYWETGPIRNHNIWQCNHPLLNERNRLKRKRIELIKSVQSVSVTFLQCVYVRVWEMKVQEFFRHVCGANVSSCFLFF